MNRRHTFPLTLTALAIAAAFPSYAANPETAASDAAQSQSLKEIYTILIIPNANLFFSKCSLLKAIVKCQQFVPQ